MINPSLFSTQPPEALRRLLTEIRAFKAGSRIEDYRPYAKQREFHASGGKYRERLLMAGNQLGKTLSAGMEVAMHLTGRYPDWWPGYRFTRPVVWWVAGINAELTRDGAQRILMGRAQNIGTGTIRKDCIVGSRPRRGVADALDNVTVQHVSGGLSVVQFKGYDQGPAKFQSETVDGVWLDEEPDLQIYTEALTRTNAVPDAFLMMTFTPLLGMSDVVKRFLLEASPDRIVVNMTIDDVEHFSPEQKRRIIDSYPEHEREARTKGTPILGSGRVFPVTEASIREPAIAPPEHWARICGMDFGWDHPTAAAWCLYDKDADALHVYDCYRERQGLPVIHAAAMKARGDWIPVAWPADGYQHEKGTGRQLRKVYADLGLSMLDMHAQFPSSKDHTEQSIVSVEAGVLEMLEWMQEGRLKVAEHLHDWFEEFRLYHRKDGKIVKEMDDLMSATRYAFMMRRFAITKPEQRKKLATKSRGTGTRHSWMGH